MNRIGESSYLQFGTNDYMTPYFLYTLRIKKLEQDIFRALEDCDPDAIHDVRVSIRRMLMLCSVLKESGKAPYSKKELRILKKKFRRAGALRDIQVQLHLLNSWEDKLQLRFDLYKQHLERRGKTLQKYFRTAFLTINLKKAIPNRVSRIAYRRAIEKGLQGLDDDFRLALQQTGSLHKLRIISKKLKYTLEVQQACYPGFGSTETFRKYLAQVQDLLGAWHDIETGLQHINYFIKRHRIKIADPALYDNLIAFMRKEKETILLEIRSELQKQIPIKELLSVVLS